MRPGVLALVIISGVLLTGACVQRVHDYTFAVTGFVTTEGGKSLTAVAINSSTDGEISIGR